MSSNPIAQPTTAAIILAGLIIGTGIFLAIDNLRTRQAEESNVTNKTETGLTLEDPRLYPTPLPDDQVTSYVDQRPMFGRVDAPVTMIEFTDYQCPVCKRFNENYFDRLKSEYIETGRVRYVVKDFPLDGHLLAEPAAVGANCVFHLGGLGQFEGLRRRLFNTQDDWKTMSPASFQEFISNLVAEAGMDREEFLRCYEDNQYYGDVQNDISQGLAYNVYGTPTIFINGVPVVGYPPTYEHLTAIIDTEISKNPAE